MTEHYGIMKQGWPSRKAEMEGSRRSAYRRLAWLVALISPVVVLLGLDASGKPVTNDPTSALGRKISGLQLTSLDGSSMSLHDKLKGRAALLVVMGADDCSSCANMPLELRIIRSRLPHLETVVVGSGPRVASFRSFFSEARLESYSVLDRDRTLLRSLGVADEPLTILVDSTGRILFIDARPPSMAAQYPLGRLLPELAGTLVPK